MDSFEKSAANVNIRMSQRKAMRTVQRMIDTTYNRFPEIEAVINDATCTVHTVKLLIKFK